MTTLFKDDFVGVAGREVTFGGRPLLAGDAWYMAFETASSNLDLQGDGTASPDDTELSDQVQYACFPEALSPDHDPIVEIETTTAGTDDPVFVFGRAETEEDLYAALGYPAGADPDLRLIKVVGGTITSLGTANVGGLGNGDLMKLELRDAAKKLFRDVGAGFVEELSSADAELFKGLKYGVGFGNIAIAGNDISTGWNLGSFQLDLGGPSGGDAVVQVKGELIRDPASPAQIVANQNDYDPGALSVVRLTTDASRNITGLARSGGNTEGDQLRIINVGANALVLTDQDAASTAANRIITATGASVTLSANDSAELTYDSTTARWRITSVQQ